MEALACIDENGQSDNPDYLEGEHTKYEQSCEFDRLNIVELSVSEKEVQRVLSLATLWFARMATLRLATA